MLEEEINKKAGCVECGSSHIVWDDLHHEDYCDDCGLVIDSRDFVNRPETDVKKVHHELKSSSIIGPNTSIGRGYKDHSGKRIPGKNRKLVTKLKLYDGIYCKDRNPGLMAGYIAIDHYVSEQGLPEAFRREVKSIYKKVQKKGLNTGREIEDIILATLYITCRSLGYPRTLNEFTSNKKQRKRIGNHYKVTFSPP